MIRSYVEFTCPPCGRSIKVWVRIALIHSQAGQTEQCVCGAWFAITDQAVMQVQAPTQKPIDAEGKDYVT